MAGQELRGPRALVGEPWRVLDELYVARRHSTAATSRIVKTYSTDLDVGPWGALDKLPELSSQQQRRRLNGSSIAAIQSTVKFNYLYHSSQTAVRKFGPHRAFNVSWPGSHIILIIVVHSLQRHRGQEV
ncbi:hypothetical protein PIIN_10267 [Serendipita indica DSM 11827]|uniref:Uncharacterized protein n=1 Tax=Serendipita indica (strain DSM 11827) TaxID=1109443 RepID=G4TY79_SERID|nr:hypothetical protein PIIN_10267 [Serendipita indica DSM 11827]